MDFQRASTGLPGLDKVLEQLRLGDNVVWQVDQIEDYIDFARSFAREALKTGKTLVYCRFGEHPPILEPHPSIRLYTPDASSGFEPFSAAVREMATREGEGVYYVFDCLSELLAKWNTDLMIGNFFRVTCPYLFKLNTIAYFALLRDFHSYRTIARIRETTQILLDLYHREKRYIHPLKVWNRYSPTMFLPHVEAGAEFIPLTNSADAAQLFSNYPSRLTDAERQLDYWDHLFINAAEMMEAGPESDSRLPEIRRALLDQLLEMVLSRDEMVLGMARDYITIEDLLQIKSRLIGSGLIGGKAVGLIISRKILTRTPEQNWNELLEAHDSFYIGTDVFYTYLVENGCWELRQEQKATERYFTAAAELREKLAQGSFPEMIREPILEMLEYFGQAPIIVRSSSLLEDGFGNAFAGKYESVFCANQGNLQERYQDFLEAVRTVYASTMSEDALAYRLQRGLSERDEQMALLVQRVSGSHRDGCFFPDLAGVALSTNLYTWRPEMDPKAGMVRLVYGLGTRAVDRSDDDYARLIALDEPEIQPYADSREAAAYSQRRVDLLNLAENRLETVDLQELYSKGLITHTALLSRPEMEGPLWQLDFEGLIRQTPFPALMSAMLKSLESVYRHPVDTEFTLNFRPDASFRINLLQCRPLQGKYNREHVAIPAQIPRGKIIFESRGRFMGGSLQLSLGHLVYVVPELYANLTQSQKYSIARLIGGLNRSLPEREETAALLLGPGRWGTTTPSLGIPVSFAEINRFAAIGEMAFTTAGFVPELSYGSHFFQDLVETDIFYLAIDDATVGVFINREYLTQAPNHLAELLPAAAEWAEVVKVIIPEKENELRLHADLTEQRVLCWWR